MADGYYTGDPLTQAEQLIYVTKSDSSGETVEVQETPAPEPKVKRIDEMTLSDYQRGYLKVRECSPVLVTP